MFRVNEQVKNMSGLDRMILRAGYKGYDRQDDRNVTSKYKSFEAALKNSYQAEWITLDKGTENERRWRCLINPSRLTEQFDKKVISIDFESGVQEGTVFYWDRTDRYWMINLQQHTEEAYFRGIITRAEFQIDVDGTKYWAILRGPVETTTEWKGKHNIYWNNLNYSLALQVPKNSQTVHYFTRHKIIKVQMQFPDVNTGEMIEEFHNWKVVATDKYSSEFLIDVYLDEWNDNAMEDARVQDGGDGGSEDSSEQETPHIEGSDYVYGYDTDIPFSIVGDTGGTWTVDNDKVAKITSIEGNTCFIEVLVGKKSSFTLTYQSNLVSLVKQVEVKSF